MSKKYTYAREIDGYEGRETFTAVEFDSFDEAIKAVDKGISDRKIEISKVYKKPITGSIPPSVEGPKKEGNVTNQTPVGGSQNQGGESIIKN